MPLTDHLVQPLPERPGARPAPFGMDLVEFEAVNGLPARIPLASDLTLVLSAPTGALSVWLDLPPETVVFEAADEAAAVLPGAPGAAAADGVPFRFNLLSGSRLVAVAPLRLGKRLLLPETGAPLLDLVLLDATITAGSVRGLPLSGARVRLAWRRPGRIAGDPPRADPLPPTPPRPGVRQRLQADPSGSGRRFY